MTAHDDGYVCAAVLFCVAAPGDEQEPVDPTTEEPILIATSDCKGVPMRRIDAETVEEG